MNGNYSLARYELKTWSQRKDQFSLYCSHSILDTCKWYWDLAVTVYKISQFLYEHKYAWRKLKLYNQACWLQGGWIKSFKLTKMYELWQIPLNLSAQQMLAHSFTFTHQVCPDLSTFTITQAFCIKMHMWMQINIRHYRVHMSEVVANVLLVVHFKVLNHWWF